MRTWLFGSIHAMLSWAVAATTQCSHVEQIVAGDAFTCVLLDTKQVKCWGRSSGYEDSDTRGDELNEMGNSLPTIDFGTNTSVKAIFARAFHTCVILETNEVKCWGANLGRLGLGDKHPRGREPGEMGDNLPVVDLGENVTVKTLAVGFSHSCALLESNQIKCWGASNHGQLGGTLETISNQPLEMGDNLPTVEIGTNRSVMSVACGEFHTCVLLDTHQVKCFGFAEEGQVGSGDDIDVGTRPSHMGDNLPYVDLGEDAAVRKIELGESFSCAILYSNQVKCWGSNGGGELGNGGGFDLGDGSNEMGNNLPPVSFEANTSVKAIALGVHHACAILDTDQLTCWGRNSQGQLGYGDTTLRSSPTNVFGKNNIVDLGRNVSVKSVAVGWDHTCAILNTNEVKCWGRNRDGQLGYGDASSVPWRGRYPNQMGDNLPIVNVCREPETYDPTSAPTDSPTRRPTEYPTRVPSSHPTSEPTQTPTVSPTDAPTPNHTDAPTNGPTNGPTNSPTNSPIIPTGSPTSTPFTPPVSSLQPSNAPMSSAHSVALTISLAHISSFVILHATSFELQGFFF